MGNENEILEVYKRNSITEWLQKTGQATDFSVNTGKFFDYFDNAVLSQFVSRVQFYLLLLRKKTHRSRTSDVSR